jgi:hypothetical protein
MPSLAPQLRPPARWEARFCEAQEWVAIFHIRHDQAQSSLRRSRSREVLEDAGDDVADTAGRAVAFLDLVPAWGPGRALIDAERTMLMRAERAGDLLERIAVTGPVTEARLRPARMAMAAVAREVRAVEAVSARAAVRGLPCAIPRIVRDLDG